MGEIAVRMEGVSKKYFLGRERSNIRAAIPGRIGEQQSRQTFLALDDVSFEAAPGEALGIIGPNGAGKSTALKVVAGIVRPTSGNVTRPKRMVSVIELGLGFDPDLNALENIEFGGSMLGMSPTESRAKRDEIMDFAELGGFADMPIKRYSTGMVARLGFALATSVEADLFVVDEVLSVGDWGFQRRSLERMRQINADGAAVLFVSHNLWVVGQLCDRAVLLEAGKVGAVGDAHKVIGTYVGQTPYLNDLPSESAKPTEPPPEEAIDNAPSPVPVAMLTSSEPSVGERSEAEPWQGSDQFSEMMQQAQGVPYELIDVHMDPARCESAAPVTLHGELVVHWPVPGARLVVGAYWEGFAAFSTPDELPGECLRTRGRYRFEVRYPILPSSPALVTFQLAIVNADEPDDPEQMLPNAIVKASADVKVVGPVTGRPGVKFPREWHVERTDGPLDRGSSPDA